MEKPPIVIVYIKDLGKGDWSLQPIGSFDYQYPREHLNYCPDDSELLERFGSTYVVRDYWNGIDGEKTLL